MGIQCKYSRRPGVLTLYSGRGKRALPCDVPSTPCPLLVQRAGASTSLPSGDSRWHGGRWKASAKAQALEKRALEAGAGGRALERAQQQSPAAHSLTPARRVTASTRAQLCGPWRVSRCPRSVQEQAAGAGKERRLDSALVSLGASLAGRARRGLRSETVQTPLQVLS